MLSINRIQEKNATIIFKSKGEVIIKNDKNDIIFTGNSFNGLYGVEFKININMGNRSMAFISKKFDFKIWHERFGHMSHDKFNQIKNNDVYEDNVF